MFTAGEFADAVRSQFMEERMDYFRAVETAVYEESGFQVTAHATDCIARSSVPELRLRPAMATAPCKCPTPPDCFFLARLHIKCPSFLVCRSVLRMTFASMLQEECTRAMVSAALLKVDHEMTEKQARTLPQRMHVKDGI
jgi:hypothetical protein